MPARWAWTWDHCAFGDKAPNQNPSGLGVFNYNVRWSNQLYDADSGLNYNARRVMRLALS
jgi:hypothetical protein